MLAIHDQENLAFSRQVTTAAKQQDMTTRQLQPKTPGQRFPKTPVRLPLNDENANTFARGKSVLGQRGGQTSKLGNKSALVTPLDNRTRTVLGDKTTNAKARTVQTGGVKKIVREIEQTQLKPTTAKQPRKLAIQPDAAKLEIHTDKSPTIEVEEDIEYAPPPVPEIQYESDIINVDKLDLSGLRPENQLRGYYEYYFNPRNADGVPLRQIEEEREREQYWKENREAEQRDMDNMQFNIGDMSEFMTKAPTSQAALPKTGRLGTKPPGTIATRKAASALSTAPKTAARPALGQVAPEPVSSKRFLAGKTSSRPVVSRKTSAERATAIAASRSTLGYNQGRNARSVVQARGTSQPQRYGLSRSISTASTESDKTITPARLTQGQAGKASGSNDLGRLEFLSIFDIDGEDDNHFGISEEVMFRDDFEEEVELKPDVE